MYYHYCCSHTHHYRCLPFLLSEIKKMVKTTESPLSDTARKEIEAKLERCRNQQNNPNSSQYRANYSEWDDEDLPIASSPFSGDVSMGMERIRSPSAY